MGMPFSRVEVWNSAIDSASSVLATDVSAGNVNSQRVTLFRAQAIVATACALHLRILSSTTGSYATGALLHASGTTMTINALYTFVFEARNGFSYNFEPSATTTFRTLWLSEIQAEVI